MSANTLLISDLMIKERSPIHGNIDAKLIYNDIKTAQDMYILPILGTALFAKLQTLIDAGTISAGPNAAYKTLLDTYIADTLIHYTLMELPTTLSYQFWNKGVSRKVGQDSELPSMSELMDISNRFRNKAEWYANRLRLYVIEKASSLFPEYLSPGNSIDTVIPDAKSFSSPIYLGDEDNPWCNKGGFNGQPYSE